MKVEQGGIEGWFRAVGCWEMDNSLEEGTKGLVREIDSEPFEGLRT